MRYSVAAMGLVGIASIVASACSSGNTSSPQQTTCDPCDDGGGGTTTVGAGHDTNPDGIPYPAPTNGYGRTPRSGSTPGSVIQNFKFLGYLNGDKSQGLTTISLADYYDPCQTHNIKLLHLSVAAVWCTPCNQETDAIVAAKSMLDSQGIVVLQALDDGPIQGKPAKVSDLDYWVQNHKSNFTEMLDPGLANLGGFFDAAAIPWNADIDPRTMEILDSSEGWSGDVSSEISTSVLPAMPSYQLPAQCP